MERMRLIGGVLTVLGFLGYVVGVAVTYPGRALSILAVMTGLTLVGVGGME